MRYLLPLVALCAGCALSPQELRQRVAQATPYQLCEGMYGARAEYLPSIEAEINRRGVDCGQYAGIIQSRQQAEAARQAAAMQILRQMTPPPAQTMNCSSYRVGNTVQTSCN